MQSRNIRSRRSNTRRRPLKSKNKSRGPLLALLVIIVSFLSYRGVKSLLPGESKSAAEKKAVAKKNNESIPNPEQPPQPDPQKPAETPAPPKNWSFENVKSMLPEKAYEDNFQPLPIAKNKALVAYAKTIPGKKPGPQGETNTEPGLISVGWDGKEYQKQDLPITALETALGSFKISELVGVPQIADKPLEEKNSKIYPLKIFSKNENLYVQAYVVDDGQHVLWAPLRHASGKKMPAAFVQGTTRNTTQQLKVKKIDNKNYLVAEYGTLEDFRSYAGYQWSVQAYAWDGSAFVFDEALSKKLTREKQSNPES